MNPVQRTLITHVHKLNTYIKNGVVDQTRQPLLFRGYENVILFRKNHEKVDLKELHRRYEIPSTTPSPIRFYETRKLYVDTITNDVLEFIATSRAFPHLHMVYGLSLSSPDELDLDITHKVKSFFEESHIFIKPRAFDSVPETHSADRIQQIYRFLGLGHDFYCDRFGIMERY